VVAAPAQTRYFPISRLRPSSNDAICAGDTARVVELLALNPDVATEVDSDGYTPLRFAWKENAPIEIVEALYEPGRDAPYFP